MYKAVNHGQPFFICIPNDISWQADLYKLNFCECLLRQHQVNQPAGRLVPVV